MADSKCLAFINISTSRYAAGRNDGLLARAFSNIVLACKKVRCIKQEKILGTFSNVESPYYKSVAAPEIFQPRGKALQQGGG